ncbi:substrate-binding domain-containing protein [Listeria ivanovii]|uniref:substrate-binding domain-containing protein n=1 Tax=Listeria ivanovii TaxID=1638 RepID=UPI0005127E3D|nr:substrate-binding domain-containing protein [Listeria ivanovii]AIS62114.1 LacI family transcriptional regulator [Listeria ivanovii subsp. londoniensis]MBC2255584.1 substrate-binding domain-containing protein [Listeria ivanovii]MBK1965513.1 substrate-binding domain-containing protein [Listeria ivanovii subsp. londoniensis]MBK1983338.1 substrate-binding domain-containing protein [Listeria ivanovii subsp. londoniensis]MBK1994680.1 substrate-binding domain-containing protein [Listeria ivanovii 
MKKVTMQDIADKLNITKNSVSQALGNKNGVSEQTKLAVFKMADELGYKYKKEIAREVVKEKFALLATSFALSQRSFFGEIIDNMKQSIIARQGELVIFPVTDEEAELHQIPEQLQNENWTGIFLLSHINTEYSKQITMLGIPVVLIDHHDPHLKADAVISQNKDGAFTAVEFLIQNNHQKIGFLGDITFSPSYEERLEGYKKALNYYQIPFNEKHAITQIKEEQTSLYKTLDALDELPTAWFCVNSGLGFILNTYLQSKGYTIPNDISIICFDNTEFTVLSKPPLTTMCTNLSFMGEKAVELMYNRIRKPDDGFVHLALATNLIVRDSVNAIKKTIQQQP